MARIRALPDGFHDTHDWQELLAWCRRKAVAARSDPRSVRRFLDDRWPRRLARKAAACGDAELLDIFEEVLPLLREVFPEYFEDCRDSLFHRLRADLVTGELIVAIVTDSPSILEEQLVAEAQRHGHKNVRSVLASLEAVDRVHQRGDARLYPGAHFDRPGIRVPPYAWAGARFGKEQSEYAERFTQAFRNGEPLPLGGQVGYLHRMLEGLCEEDLASDRSAAVYRRVIDLYAGSYGARLGCDLLADFFFARGQISKGLAATAELHVSSLLQWGLKDTSVPFQVSYLVAWGTNQRLLTNVGETFRTEIDDRVQERLDQYHSDHGMSLLVSSYLDENPYPNETTEERLFHPLRGRGHTPSVVLPNVTERTALFQASIRELFRDGENEVRIEHGLPRIGELWVSETALLALIRQAFPTEDVQHQGRPSWLGRQSLDIYLPERGIAFEYQGVQHDRPVERFGGKEAFDRQQVRDVRKRSLCEEHGVVLVEVRPGYDPDQVLIHVSDAIAQQLV